MIESDGAQGRSRTADTAIFSRMLYQLSYLGAAAAGAAFVSKPAGEGWGLIGKLSGPVQRLHEGGAGKT